MKGALLFQNQPAFELANAASRLIISAEHGARILRWEKRGREIITWPDDADWTKILKVRGGDPVLFPFIARHFVDGKNELWRDATGVVRPMPQHGFARDARFTVVDDGARDTLRMRLTSSAETEAFYPFAFRFDVVVRLSAGPKLEVRFETANTGKEALPYYAGHHFYFALPHDERADWRLELPCAEWGHQAADGSIVREKAVETELHLDDRSIIDRFQIGPTEPVITLRHARNSQRLAFELVHEGSVPWYAVTTWTQAPESDFFCIEPWLGLPNAIHHGEGLRWLQPGETETASLVLDASRW